MSNYIYRVLNNLDESTKEINCKQYWEYFPYTYDFQECYLGEALDDITRHILKGNIRGTFWISASTDYNILTRFATSQDFRRPLFAVIKNHNKTTLISPKLDIDALNCSQNRMSIEKYKQQFRYTKLRQIDKFVINLYENIYIYNLLVQVGIIYNSKRELKKNICDREWYYINRNKEVLILYNIPYQDYTTLYPLQYDVLYTLLKNGSIEEIDENILNILLNNLSLPVNIEKDIDYSLKNVKDLYENLTPEEKWVFNEIYINRTPLSVLSEKNHININYIINIQKGILKKALTFLNNKRLTGFKLELIKTIEEDKN